MRILPAWAVLAVAVLVLPALPPAAPAQPVSAPPAVGALGIAFDGSSDTLERPANGMVPHTAGSVVHTTFLYGPHTVPPGWDLDREALGLPFQTGFVTKLSFRLQDAATGAAPTNLQVHVHHGLWFGVAPAADNPPFVFGTGEERTAVDLTARAQAEPGGPLYGIPFQQGRPQVIILMLHNKETVQHTVNIFVDVDFVYGTAAQIQGAHGCMEAVPLRPVDGCVAGRAMHALTGALWGDVFDVPRQAQGSGVFTYPTDGQFNRYGPPDYGLPYKFGQNLSPRLLNATFVAAADATIVFGQGHLHPGGIATIVTNVGPVGRGCEADLDGDGLPGVTLFRSDKMDRDPDAWPYSEDFQMGVTKPGYRAPVHAGDRLLQFGLYANRDVATYQAMTFAALQLDTAQVPPPRSPGCALADVAPRLLDDPTGSAVQTVPNRAWDGPMLPLCDVPGAPPCNGPGTAPAPGLDTQTIAIGEFAYAPGDRGFASPFGDPPLVHAARGVTFVNLDMAAVIRHTVTSCAWPCDGVYTANYPRPDGVFDSDRLGNLDLLDGGSVPPDGHDDNVWTLPPDLPVGLYAYFCRIHPTMRGAFEVVP